MRDLLRRLHRRLWPVPPPGALAALDGGPGLEPRPTDNELADRIRARAADIMEIPEAWLTPADDLNPNLTVDDVVAMRERFARPLDLLDRAFPDG